MSDHSDNEEVVVSEQVLFELALDDAREDYCTLSDQKEPVERVRALVKSLGGEALESDLDIINAYLAMIERRSGECHDIITNMKIERDTELMTRAMERGERY